MTGGGVDQSHVIDYVWHRQRVEPWRELVETGRFQIEVHVPAERLDARHDSIERRHVGTSSQASEKSEAAAVDAAGGQAFELTIGRLIIGIPNAAIAPATLRDRI